MPLNRTAAKMKHTLHLKEIRKFFLIYLTICILLTLALFVPQHLTQRRSFFLQLETMQREEVNLHYTVMTDMFNSITSDLMVLAHQEGLKRFVENGDPADLLPFSSLALSMDRYKKLYDKIRFIDHRGMERIRIQTTGDKVFQVSPKHLQNKAHRYYVEETRKLPPNGIFMSPLDLNKENNVIERPFKPMLRMATPLYNTSGQYRGMVILNYNGKRFLERMQQTTPDRQFSIIPHLTNREGYWFLNDQPGTEWGFMLKERSKFTFQNRFPQAWEKAIAHQEKGHVMTPNGLFSFATFYPEQECRTFLEKNNPNTKETLKHNPNPLAWKIIFHTPREQIQASLHSQNMRLVFMLILFTGGGTLVSWGGARYMVRKQTQRLSQANDQLKKEIQHREKVAEALQKSEARFRSTFEQAAVGMAHISPEGKVLRINERTCHILGYSRSELLQMDIQELTHPSDLQADLDLIQQVLDGKISRYTLEKRYIHKNGNPIWCNRSVSLLRNPDGTPHYFISVLEDITPRKKAEAQLHAAKIEAEKANMAKNNFLASISHELRTPLNAVIGFSEVLLDQFFGPLNKQQVEYVNDILQSGHHLLTMINDILDLSKVETKQTTFLPVPTALEPVMDESLKTTGPMMKEKQIQVIRDLPEEFSKIHLHADPVKLRQILSNLLSNAVKFTSKDGTITITCKTVQDVCPPSEVSGKDNAPPDASQPITPPALPGVEICIQDTGIGLAPRHMDKIFESFFQVESGISSKTPGTGLGLPLVKRFVEMHQGRIWVSSDGLGKGSCICFTIPLAQDEVPITYT